MLCIGIINISNIDLCYVLSFFLSWVSKTQPNHWTHYTKKLTLPRDVLDVRKRHFLMKNAFAWKAKKPIKSIARIGVWVWFRIAQTSPNVRAR